MRHTLATALALTLVAPLASAQSPDRDAAAMLGWINEARAAQGVSPLRGDARLDAVAAAHSRDMATHRFFSHDSPTTGAPAARTSAAGIAFRSLAENIAMNQSARAAHEALLRSPGHRANLLNPNLRRVGIGLVRGADGLYVTQLFATLPNDGDAPPPSAPAPDVTPREEPAPTPAREPACEPATPQGEQGDGAILGGLPGLLRLPGWTAPTTTATTSRARVRRRGRRFTVPTPFGAMRVEVPAEVVAPWGDDDREAF